MATEIKAEAVLSCPLRRNDAKATDIRSYLKELLHALWEKDEGFSGKRPFGNSGWKGDIHLGLVAANLISGTIDEDGLVSVDEETADELIYLAIKAL